MASALMALGNALSRCPFYSCTLLQLRGSASLPVACMIHARKHGAFFIFYRSSSADGSKLQARRIGVAGPIGLARIMVAWPSSFRAKLQLCLMSVFLNLARD
jgi:hypothetical protein